RLLGGSRVGAAYNATERRELVVDLDREVEGILGGLVPNLIDRLLHARELATERIRLARERGALAVGQRPSALADRIELLLELRDLLHRVVRCAHAVADAHQQVHLLAQVLGRRRHSRVFHYRERMRLGPGPGAQPRPVGTRWRERPTGAARPG